MKDNSLTPPIKAIYLVPQSMITITEEGLRLRVGDTLSVYKERSELTAKLIGSVTFFVSVLLSFLATSEFRSFVFPSSVWTAFFLFCLVFSLALHSTLPCDCTEQRNQTILFPALSKILQAFRQPLRENSNLRKRRIG